MDRFPARDPAGRGRVPALPAAAGDMTSLSRPVRPAVSGAQPHGSEHAFGSGQAGCIPKPPVVRLLPDGAGQMLKQRTTIDGRREALLTWTDIIPGPRGKLVPRQGRVPPSRRVFLDREDYSGVEDVDERTERRIGDAGTSAEVPVDGRPPGWPDRSQRPETPIGRCRLFLGCWRRYRPTTELTGTPNESGCPHPSPTRCGSPSPPAKTCTSDRSKSSPLACHAMPMVYIRADRVFTMSKTKNSNFPGCHRTHREGSGPEQERGCQSAVSPRRHDRRPERRISAGARKDRHRAVQSHLRKLCGGAGHRCGPPPLERDPTGTTPSTGE